MIVPRNLLERVGAVAMKAVADIVVGDPLSLLTTHGAMAN